MTNLKPYTKYKPSNIAWLGDIPEHWEVRKLKYLAESVLGKMLCNEDKGGYFKKPYLKSKNIQWLNVDVSDVEEMWFSDKELIQYRLKKNDLVLSEGGEVGKVCLWNEEIKECYIQNSAHKVTVNNGNSAKFYLYLLFSYGKEGVFDAITNKVSIGHLTKDKLINLKCLYSPLEEQTAIANFLDYKLSKIDRFIQKKKQLIKLLNEQKAGIINDAVTKGLNPNAKMKPSNIEWLGDIPEHWEVRKLKYLVSKIGDVDHYMPPTIENGIPYVMTGNLEDFVSNIDFQSCKKVSQLDYDNLSKKIKSAKGDVILARYATIGTVAYIDIDLEFLVSYSCVTIKPNPSKLLGLYLFYYFKTNVFTLEIRNQVNVNTQGNVGIRDLKEVRIILPPYHEQINLVEFIEKETVKLNQAIATIEKEIALTQEYRVALIAEAVTGKIDVRDYEIPETPVVELYEVMEDEMSLAAEEEVGYGIE